MPEFSEIRGPRGQNSPPDGKRYNLSDGKRYNLSDGGGTVCRTGAVQSVGRGRYSLSDGGRYSLSDMDGAFSLRRPPHQHGWLCEGCLFPCRSTGQGRTCFRTGTSGKAQSGVPRKSAGRDKPFQKPARHALPALRAHHGAAREQVFHHQRVDDHRGQRPDDVRDRLGIERGLRAADGG